MNFLKALQIAIIIIKLLKKEEITALDIVETVLPYINKQIGQEEAEALAQLIALLVE